MLNIYRCGIPSATSLSFSVANILSKHSYLSCSVSYFKNCRITRYNLQTTLITPLRYKQSERPCSYTHLINLTTLISNENHENSKYTSITCDTLKSNCLTSLNETKRNMSRSSAEVPDKNYETMSKSIKKNTNRLASEKSPYLLQHAHNPVDWYPWGEEAIEKARRENKLIFLSVGYSTCHWCHVMEHESFENETVADLMNKHFVNIKVDREERPDIDRIYMQFVLMMNGSGGWPMSVWLTPDLAPITAGTYFPPHDRWGMPSFTTVLKTVASKWANNQNELKASGLEVISAIKRSLSKKPHNASPFDLDSCEAKLHETLLMFEKRFDANYGGFGSHPKFPEVSRINFLFHAYIVTKNIEILDMALKTLKFIARGGIRDHIFGGFARYSVDSKWHIPHFEKMLYDQGQLMTVYANAYKLTRDDIYLECADSIYRYICTDLQHSDGGYFAGEDADSLPKYGDTNKVEGAFYAWTYNEIQEAIEQNIDKYENLHLESNQNVFNIYASHYDIRQNGNVSEDSDPHGHLLDKNILIMRGPNDETCEKFAIESNKLKQLLTITNEILYNIRRQRPRPHLDTKIICSWNSLILTGLSKLANCGTTKRSEYLSTAKKLVDFIREKLYDQEKKILKRSAYGVGINDSTLLQNIEDGIDGFLDDYAFLIKGLLDYYKASLDDSALIWAKELQDKQDELFWDNKCNAYFYSQANSTNVIVRLKDDSDGAEPCGNSISTHNLILLSHYFDDPTYRARAIQCFDYYSYRKPFGYTLPEMLSALMLHENGLDLVAIVGPNSELTNRFVEICRKYYIPGMIIIHVNPQNNVAAYNKRLKEKFRMVNDQPTVYICHDKVCRMPVTDPQKLEENLTENFLLSRNL